MKKIKLINNPFADRRLQKSTVAVLWIVCALCLFAAHFGCKKHVDNVDNVDNDCECFPSIGDGRISFNCMVSSFLEGVSMYSKCSDLYVIKGIALDKYEYGCKIELLEDLKGNFPENLDTFIVWGDGNTAFELNRLDYFSMYEDQDVLIMLLTHVRDLSEVIPPEETWSEKPEDFTTIPCTKSILKLSDGYVTGYLTPVDSFTYLDQTMQWLDFQKKLHKLLNTK